MNNEEKINKLYNEKANECAKRYYKEHREERLIYQKEYNKAHKEQIYKYYKEYYQRNKNLQKEKFVI